MCWYGIRLGKMVWRNEEGTRAEDKDRAVGGEGEAELKNEKDVDDGVIFEGEEGNGAKIKDNSPAKRAANRI